MNDHKANKLDELTLVRLAEGIRVFINGIDLVDMLREYEEPLTQKEDPGPEPAGYTVVQPEDFLKNAGITDSEDDLLLLQCDSCDEIGCWPMGVQVKRVDNEVIWSNFQQPHRSISSHTYWDYSGFGPFRFNASEYDNVLASVTDPQRTIA